MNFELLGKVEGLIEDAIEDGGKDGAVEIDLICRDGFELNSKLGLAENFEAGIEDGSEVCLGDEGFPESICVFCDVLGILLGLLDRRELVSQDGIRQDGMLFEARDGFIVEIKFLFWMLGSEEGIFRDEKAFGASKERPTRGSGNDKRSGMDVELAKTVLGS